MRVLTTAIDEGLHKVPDAHHKAPRYRLAPGDAMKIDPEPREVVKIGPKTAEEAEYLYLLSWIDGRTVAEFRVKGVTVAQPIKPDPVPRKARGEGRAPPSRSEEPAGEAPGEEPPPPALGRRRLVKRRKLPSLEPK